MASDSATKFIKRNRPPRVNISYEDPYDSEKMVELPFVMGVMSDLSGNASEVEKPPVAERDFTRVDQDSLDDYMSSIKPAVAMSVDNKLDPEAGDKLSVKLEFSKMDDLSPGEIARQVPSLNKLLQARQQLANLQRYMNGKSKAQDQLKELLNDPELMAALAEKSGPADDAAEAGDDDES